MCQFIKKNILTFLQRLSDPVLKCLEYSTERFFAVDSRKMEGLL